MRFTNEEQLDDIKLGLLTIKEAVKMNEPNVCIHGLLKGLCVACDISESMDKGAHIVEQP